MGMFLFWLHIFQEKGENWEKNWGKGGKYGSPYVSFSLHRGGLGKSGKILVFTSVYMSTCIYFLSSDRCKRKRDYNLLLNLFRCSLPSRD